MATWYLNPDSTTQDGLSRETGYHTFEDLDQARALSENDIVYDEENRPRQVFLNVTSWDKDGNILFQGNMLSFLPYQAG